MSHDLLTRPEYEVFHLSIRNIHLPGAVGWLFVLSRFGHHFIVVLCKPKAFDGHQHILATVQLIGSRKQAENFAYRLELKSQRRRVTWEATPRSIHEGVSFADMSSDCLVLNACTAQQFADKGRLIFDVSFSIV
jgi:E3 ubiquitin-protein ligase SIAH1